MKFGDINVQVTLTYTNGKVILSVMIAAEVFHHLCGGIFSHTSDLEHTWQSHVKYQTYKPDFG